MAKLVTIQITTTKTETELRVKSEYSASNVSELKTHGGKWDSATKEWVFTNGGMKNGASVIDELFGSSEETVYVEVGKGDTGQDYITNAKAIELGVAIPRPECAENPQAGGACQVRPAKFGWREDGSQIVLGGYSLASRRGRDFAANAIETLVQGVFGTSGGSVKSPRANCSDDSVFGLNVRKDFAIRHGLISKDAAKIALEVERTALLARLAEIDDVLRDRYTSTIGT